MKLTNLVGDRFKERPAGAVIDSHALMLYYKYKLVRFTGVPLVSGVWRLNKNKQRIKTKQCAPRVGA